MINIRPHVSTHIHVLVHVLVDVSGMLDVDPLWWCKGHGIHAVCPFSVELVFDLIATPTNDTALVKFDVIAARKNESVAEWFVSELVKEHLGSGLRGGAARASDSLRHLIARHADAKVVQAACGRSTPSELKGEDETTS